MFTGKAFLITALIMLLGCATTRDISKEVEKDTREKRKYALVMSAQGMGYTLNLRTEHFFDYQGKAPGESNSFLYAGTYEWKGDSLMLGFYNSYKPEDLTGTGRLYPARKEIILFSKDPAKHRRLTVTTE